MLVFRFLHIVSGALWVGSAFLFSGFIGPSAAEVGPSAGPLLTALVKKRKLPKVIKAISGITVLAGWILWLRDMDLYGGLGDWLSSSFGAVLTVGAVLATTAFVIGLIGVAPNVEKLVDLGGEIAAGGGQPTPEQGAEMGRIQKALETASKIRLQDRPGAAPSLGERDGHGTVLVTSDRYTRHPLPPSSRIRRGRSDRSRSGSAQPSAADLGVTRQSSGTARNTIA